MVLASPFAAACRSFSCLPLSQSGEYVLSGDGYKFSSETDPHTTDGSQPVSVWFTLYTQVPVTAHRDDLPETWAGPCVLRPSAKTPHFSVHHDLQNMLKCAYDADGNGNSTEESLSFSIPLHFAHLPSLIVPPSPTPSPVGPLEPYNPGALTFFRPHGPYGPTSLPAYSQLFHPNGERKTDRSVQLPIYSARSREDETCLGLSGDEVMEASTGASTSSLSTLFAN